ERGGAGEAVEREGAPEGDPAVPTGRGRGAAAAEIPAQGHRPQPALLRAQSPVQPEAR
ncbi:hypothetical protein HGM15179_022105, partial [Zosterops borbonicus]